MSKKQTQEWKVYLLRQKATFVGCVNAADAKSAIAVAIEELEIPAQLRGKVSVQLA